MYSHTQYQDLLGSEGPEYLLDAMDDHQPLPVHWHNHTDMSYIDPQLRSSPAYDAYHNLQCQTSLETRHSFTSYDITAHGFSPRSLHMEVDSVLPQFGLFDPGRQTVDQFRHLRHFSPTDPFGFALSSNTDSSASDYVHSPDMAHQIRDLPVVGYNHGGAHGNSIAMPSHTTPTWYQDSPFLSSFPSAPVLANHTVPSMRHLQVTPDPEPEYEEEPVRPTVQGSSTTLGVLEIPEQVLTPPDSGRERSVNEDDDKMTDQEDDNGVDQTENDSDFAPVSKFARRRFSTNAGSKQHSVRQAQGLKVVIDPKARISKSSSNHSTPRAKSKKKPPVTTTSHNSDKNFPCTFHHYGCCATFANKNEWKRHVSSQHLQLGFYRCDMGTCVDHVKGPNDFNRKDLFTQHCRRMHAPWSAQNASSTKKNEASVLKKDKDAFEKKLETIRARCWMVRRKAPSSTKCGFCGQKFGDGGSKKGSKGVSSWEERMEHVGRHFERDGSTAEDEAVDVGLRDWAVQEGVVVETPRQGKPEFWLVDFQPAVGGRRGRGERRSQRLVKVEEDQDDDDAMKERADDNDEFHEKTNGHARSTRGVIKTEDNSDGDDEDVDTDAEAESDVDAEAEDDDA